MRAWLVGREVTAARTTTGAAVARLVGETVEEVQARGKHLLVRFTGNLTLHSHMQMTGSWHVYSTGDRWRRPAHEARIVLDVTGDRVAVCFNAPTVEVIERRAEHLHPALARLGPDVLDPPVDLDEVRRRAQTRAANVAIADLLLDQGVVAGIGNIWRAESLFAERTHPATPHGDLPPDRLDAIVLTASRLMGAPTRPRPFVYGRTGRPCRRCRAPVTAARFANGRVVYWCPGCQPAAAVTR